jgi:alpha-galactosidase/6-phospho-beta-glucosidase family protein
LRCERLEDEVFVGSAGTGSWDLAFRAFLNVPLVSNHPVALKMFEEMFDAHLLPQSSESPDPRARYR